MPRRTGRARRRGRRARDDEEDPADVAPGNEGRQPHDWAMVALSLRAAYRGSRHQKGATSAATSTTTASATTIPQMNGSAASAAPIMTATQTTKAIPARMKTHHVTSLRVMMGGRSTPRSSTLIPPVFFLRFEERLRCLAVGRPTPNSPRGDRKSTADAVRRNGVAV